MNPPCPARSWEQPLCLIRMFSSPSTTVLFIAIHAKPLGDEPTEAAVFLGSSPASWFWGRMSESVCIYVLNAKLYLQPTAVVLISIGMCYRLERCANKFPHRIFHQKKKKEERKFKMTWSCLGSCFLTTEGFLHGEAQNYEQILPQMNCNIPLCDIQNYYCSNFDLQEGKATHTSSNSSTRPPLIFC